MIHPLVPVIGILGVIFLLGLIPRFGSLIQNIFLLIIFLFAIPNIDAKLGNFYSIMAVAVLVFSVMKLAPKDVQKVESGPEALQGSGLKVPFLALFMGIVFFFILRSLVSVNQGASIIGVPGLSAGSSLSFMNAGLIASLGFIEQRFFLGIYNVYKLYIRPIFSAIITPVGAFILGVVLVAGAFALFHLSAYSIAVGSLIFAFIFFTLSILAFEIPFIGEEPTSWGHAIHNGAVSVGRQLAVI